MRQGIYRFFVIIVVAVIFLLYATIGYGAYSDSLSLQGWVSVIVPTTVASPDDSSITNPEATCSLENEMPSATAGPESENETELQVDPPVTAEPRALPDESQGPQDPTTAPIMEEPEAKISISKTIFTVSSSYAGQLVPFFSSVYTDRSGNTKEKEEKPACHLENNTLVAYGSVFVEQNGLPGSAILADMSIRMGAGIRFDNTTGSDILLTRMTAAGAIEQSFRNDTDGTLSDTSVRLSPGQTGVISAYLDHGWQLDASELDLENLSGMSCAREFKIFFKAENLETNECRTYAILLVAQVIAQAPAQTSVPTEVIIAVDEAGAVLPTPHPKLEPSTVPTTVPTVVTAPDSTPEPTLEPTPEPTLGPTPEPTPEPAPTEIIEPTSALESTPAATLDQSAVPEITTEPEFKTQELPPESALPSIETAVPESAPA